MCKKNHKIMDRTIVVCYKIYTSHVETNVIVCSSDDEAVNAFESYLGCLRKEEKLIDIEFETHTITLDEYSEHATKIIKFSNNIDAKNWLEKYIPKPINEMSASLKMHMLR